MKDVLRFRDLVSRFVDNQHLERIKAGHSSRYGDEELVAMAFEFMGERNEIACELASLLESVADAFRNAGEDPKPLRRISHYALRQQRDVFAIWQELQPVFGEVVAGLAEPLPGASAVVMSTDDAMAAEGLKRRNAQGKWPEVTNWINDEYGTNFSPDAFTLRVKRYAAREKKPCRKGL